MVTPGGPNHPSTRRDDSGIHCDRIAAQDPNEDRLDHLTSTFFEIGLLLQVAVDLPGDAARQHITEALSRLEEAVRELRDHTFAEHNPAVLSRLAQSPLAVPSRMRWSAGRAALLRGQMLRTARALQKSASENAALLEQQVGIVKEPTRVDYRAEVKRWRDFAERAELMAAGLEQEA